jgi:hypothetical protein
MTTPAAPLTHGGTCQRREGATTRQNCPRHLRCTVDRHPIACTSVDTKHHVRVQDRDERLEIACA